MLISFVSICVVPEMLFSVEKVALMSARVDTSTKGTTVSLDIEESSFAATVGIELLFSNKVMSLDSG